MGCDRSLSKFFDLAPFECYKYCKETNKNLPKKITPELLIYENKLLAYPSRKIIDICSVCHEENCDAILLRCFRHYACISTCYNKLYNQPCPECRL